MENSHCHSPPNENCQMTEEPDSFFPFFSSMCLFLNASFVLFCCCLFVLCACVCCVVFSSMCSFLNASLALAYDTFTLFLPAKVPTLASFSST